MLWSMPQGLLDVLRTAPQVFAMPTADVGRVPAQMWANLGADVGPPSGADVPVTATAVQAAVPPLPLRARASGTAEPSSVREIAAQTAEPSAAATVSDVAVLARTARASAASLV